MLRENKLVPQMAVNAASPDRFLELRDHPEPWGWIEIFVLIQNLSTVLLFLPDSQQYRFAVRGLPYVSSLGLALFHYSRSKGRLPLPPGSGWLMAALVLLALSLFHPSTVFPAGIAQFVFQLSIAAPILWVSAQVKTRERLDRLLKLLFFSSAASAAVGLAQVFYPKIFMPEISSLALTMNPEVVRSLTYLGTAGQQIVRPPGLTDVPGGAAVGGLTAAFLGIVFGSQSGQSTLKRLFYFTISAVGASVIYFTQVRSLLIILVGAIVVMCLLLGRRGASFRASGSAASAQRC